VKGRRLRTEVLDGICAALLAGRGLGEVKRWVAGQFKLQPRQVARYIAAAREILRAEAAKERPHLRAKLIGQLDAQLSLLRQVAKDAMGRAPSDLRVVVRSASASVSAILASARIQGLLGDEPDAATTQGAPQLFAGGSGGFKTRDEVRAAGVAARERVRADARRAARAEAGLPDDSVEQEEADLAAAPWQRATDGARRPVARTGQGCRTRPPPAP
jgi:hypothetical protein